MNASVITDDLPQAKPSRPRERKPVNPGILVSIVFHAALILYLLHLVHPSVNLAPQKRKEMLVELAPPPPPPPPPPPKQERPPPPKLHEPPPPPQQIVTAAPEPAPEVVAVPPPPPAVSAPAPPPAAAHVLATTVPAAYYDSLQEIVQGAVKYPNTSQLNSEQGACRVRVTFARGGTIADVKLVQRAGFSALDNECREVFKRIARFPAVPESANPAATDFSIELPIEFSLG